MLAGIHISITQDSQILGLMSTYFTLMTCSDKKHLLWCMLLCQMLWHNATSDSFHLSEKEGDGTRPILRALHEALGFIDDLGHRAFGLTHRLSDCDGDAQQGFAQCAALGRTHKQGPDHLRIRLIWSASRRSMPQMRENS